MLSTTSTIAHTIWVCLPQATAALQFATEVIGFYLTTALITRRLRHRRRDRESVASVECGMADDVEPGSDDIDESEDGSPPGVDDSGQASTPSP